MSNLCFFNSDILFFLNRGTGTKSSSVPPHFSPKLGWSPLYQILLRYDWILFYYKERLSSDPNSVKKESLGLLLLESDGLNFFFGIDSNGHSYRRHPWTSATPGAKQVRCRPLGYAGIETRWITAHALCHSGFLWSHLCRSVTLPRCYLF